MVLVVFSSLNDSLGLPHIMMAAISLPSPALAAGVGVQQRAHSEMDCRSDEGKTRGLEPQAGNGGSHRFPVGCPVFTCKFDYLPVVVI